MSIGSQLRAGLAADSGIAAIVGTRIYPLLLPQKPTYEAITYQRISSSGQDGTSDRRESRWQINCYAETYAEAHTLAAAVKAFAEDYHDSPGIEYARVVNEIDDYEDGADVFRVILDVMLTTTGD